MTSLYDFKQAPLGYCIEFIWGVWYGMYSCLALFGIVRNLVHDIFWRRNSQRRYGDDNDIDQQVLWVIAPIYGIQLDKCLHVQTGINHWEMICQANYDGQIM